MTLIGDIPRTTLIRDARYFARELARRLDQIERTGPSRDWRTAADQVRRIRRRLALEQAADHRRRQIEQAKATR